MKIVFWMLSHWFVFSLWVCVLALDNSLLLTSNLLWGLYLSNYHRILYICFHLRADLLLRLLPGALIPWIWIELLCFLIFFITTNFISISLFETSITAIHCLPFLCLWYVYTFFCDVLHSHSTFFLNRVFLWLVPW